MALGFLLTACGGGEEGAGADSGLRVVGRFGTSPEGPLWAPVDLAAGAGRIWVLDAGAGRVFGYDAGGAHRITIGRKGHGPGELDQPLALGLGGDTLWVLDPGNRRIQYFDTAGRVLGSASLPDSLPPPVDLERLGGAWFASTPFAPGPILRFDLDSGELRILGAELERRARARSRGQGAIPDAYRLEAIDGRLWALHVYLPLAGIFDPGGRLLEVIDYPGPAVESGTVVEDEPEAGRIRRRIPAPATPAGALGVLRRGTERYLLTQQTTGERQRLYRLEGRAVAGRPVLAPGTAFYLTSVESGGRTYAVGLLEAAGEPGVHVLE